jgi:mono/diheme cytochrome c family protein
MSATAAVLRASITLALLQCGVAAAQEAASVERGQAKFEHSCAPCHGAGIGDDGSAPI